MTADYFCSFLFSLNERVRKKRDVNGYLSIIIRNMPALLHIYSHKDRSIEHYGGVKTTKCIKVINFKNILKINIHITLYTINNINVCLFNKIAIREINVKISIFEINI